MIGTSDGEQFSDSFEYTLDTLRKVSKGILPDAFHEAVESMPTSTNVEDRRGEPAPEPSTRQVGEGGKLGIKQIDPGGPKPMPEISGIGGGGFKFPDINKVPANTNTKLPDIMIDGKMVNNKDPLNLGDGIDINAAWNAFIKASKKADFLDKFKIVPKDEP